jgi:amino acid adenylation domain-containing protein
MTHGPSSMASCEKRRALLKKLLEQRGLSRRPALGLVPKSADTEPTMSFAQESMWVLDKLRAENKDYIIALGRRIEGPLNVSALRASLCALIDRHEILRTRFVERGDKASPEVVQGLYPDTPLTDLTGLTGRAQGLEVERLRAEEATTPFEISKAPLLRMRLVRLAADTHLLLLSIHHIVCDGWSLNIFFSELFSSYGDFVAGRDSTLVSSQLQYNDFAVWQRTLSDAGAFDAQKSYWIEQLKGAPSLLSLPTDRPRPSRASFRGETLPFTVEASLARRLRGLAHELGVTIHMLLLGAFAVLLARYSGVDDLVIGSPVANRQRPELESMMGLLVNVLALRIDLSENPSFAELMKRVRKVTLAAYENQDVPFDQVVQAVQPQRSPSYNPLFQVFFVLQNTPHSRPQVDSLQIIDIGAPTNSAKFDLSLSVTETDDALHAHFEFSQDLFECATIERMAENFQTLLASVTEAATHSVGTLELLTTKERVEIERRWQSLEAPTSVAANVVERVGSIARRTPNALAVVDRERTLTYGELDEQTTHLAHLLLRHGIRPECLVGIAMPRSLDAILAILAVLKAGGAYLPLEADHPPARLKILLETSKPMILLTLKSIKSFLPQLDVPVLFIDEIEETASALASLAPVTPNTLAYVMYTSGSTGDPKGVCIQHSALSNYVTSILDTLRLEPSMRCALIQPLTVDASLTTLWGCLCSGAALHIVPSITGLDPHALLEYLRSQRIDYLKLTPSHLSALWPEGPPRLPLRRLVLGGEPAPWEWVQRIRVSLPDCEIFNQYGPTEATIGALTYCVSAEDEPLHFSVTPLKNRTRNSEIHILDVHGHPVPIGVAGELYIGGEGLARGYLGRNDLTKQRFAPHPAASGRRLYQTGDVARIRSSGHLEYLGRSDDEFKIRGFRVSPAEVRATLMRSSGVRDAIVVGRKLGTTEPVLIAYCVARPKHELCANALRAHATNFLPPAMVPSHVVVLDELPRTKQGKVDVAALPVPRQDAMGSFSKGRVEPLDFIDLCLMRIWEAVLSADLICVSDDFFELGGNSLLAVRVMGRIQEELGTDLSTALLFQCPTIEQLGAAIRHSDSRPKEQTLVELRSGFRCPALFLLPGIGGNVLCFRDLVRHAGGDQAIFALQAREFDRPASVEEMATTYLAAVRRVQPNGPYYLAGHSFGGKVAFEMSLQLQSASEEVALLAILDGYPPEPASYAKSHDDRLRLLENLAREHRVRWDGDAARSLDLEAQIDDLASEFQRSGLLPLGDGTSYLRRLLRAVAHRQSLVYQPCQTYLGPMTLFLAADAIHGPAMGWQRHTALPVRTLAVSGGHHSMLREPYVQELARMLQDCMKDHSVRT